MPTAPDTIEQTNDLAVDLAVRVIAGRNLTAGQADRIRKAADITRLHDATLTAPGGWCVPTELAYDFSDIRASRDEPQFAVRDTDALDESPIKDQLTALLNRFSAESPSGTPDFILADLLIGVLREFNEAVSRRSEWRGESVELPSLQRQSQSNIEPEPEERPERDDIDEGPMLVAGRVKTLHQPGAKSAGKLLKEAANAARNGEIDIAENLRKIAEIRLQWGVK